MAIHFDDLPIGSDFTFVGQPGVYCKLTTVECRLTGGASSRYWINNRSMNERMVEPWHEELETLAAQLRGYLEEFIAAPTAGGYCFMRNKVTEYYSISAARKEAAHAREQERLRQVVQGIDWHEKVKVTIE